MKKIISFVLVFAIALAIGITAFAEITDINNIKYEDKTPIDTPNFKPTIDGKKDSGYTSTYEINKVERADSTALAGTKISTAWDGNTLYFFVEVPDTTIQDNLDNTWNYQRDGVWFMLFFGANRDEATDYASMKASKVFKIYPGVDQINFEGPTFAGSIEPPAEEDFEWKIVWNEGNNGYTMEVAYTVPEATAALAAGREIAFEVEVHDCNASDGLHRYFLANGYEGPSETYCTAWGAKLVLAEAVAAPDTADFTAYAVLMASVAIIGTALVVRKKH